MIKRNKSTFCVMPILDIARDELYWDFYFLNCYISIKEYPKDKNKFYILFNFNKELQAYLTVKELLIECDSYCKEITYTSQKNNYNIFVFNINKKYKNDIELFKQGKYSKFSTTYKNLIMKVHKVTNKKALFHILMKTKERQLQLANEYNHPRLEDFNELWSKPQDKEEILILTNLN